MRSNLRARRRRSPRWWRPGAGRPSLPGCGPARGDLPRYLTAVHPRYRVPHRAERAVGALVAAILLFADVRGAIGFSSFTVLAYYAIANASALTLKPFERRWPRALEGLEGEGG